MKITITIILLILMLRLDLSNQQSLFDSLSTNSTPSSNSASPNNANSSSSLKSTSNSNVQLPQTNQIVQPILQPKNISNDSNSEESVETDPVSFIFIVLEFKESSKFN